MFFIPRINTLWGITYKEINVWVFVIIWPIITLALMISLMVQQARIRRLQDVLEEKERGNNE